MKRVHEFNVLETFALVQIAEAYKTRTNYHTRCSVSLYTSKVTAFFLNMPPTRMYLKYSHLTFICAEKYYEIQTCDHHMVASVEVKASCTKVAADHAFTQILILKYSNLICSC